MLSPRWVGTEGSRAKPSHDPSITIYAWLGYPLPSYLGLAGGLWLSSYVRFSGILKSLVITNSYQGCYASNRGELKV